MRQSIQENKDDNKDKTRIKEADRDVSLHGQTTAARFIIQNSPGRHLAATLFGPPWTPALLALLLLSFGSLLIVLPHLCREVGAASRAPSR